jgi:predicted ester cyclase
MSEQNLAVVRRIVEDHWNQKNGALVSDVFTSNVSIHTPDGSLAGHEGATLLLEMYATAFPDFRFSVDDLLADGDQVVLRYTFTGTQIGELAGIAPSGRPVLVDGVGIYRMAADKCREVRLLWDKYALMQQIGVLPFMLQPHALADEVSGARTQRFRASASTLVSMNDARTARERGARP